MSRAPRKPRTDAAPQIALSKRGSTLRALTKPIPGDYEVGYARPPVASRFKPGRSGDPSDRPKGAKNKPMIRADHRPRTLVIEEAYRTVPIRDGERELTIPMAQAVLRSVSVNAARGQHRAQRLFTELVGAIEAEDRAGLQELYVTAIDYKTRWERELERRARLGVEGPEPVPHPDDILIDARTGLVYFSGPMTPHEKAAFDKVEALKLDCESEIARLRSELEGPLTRSRKAHLRAELETEERLHANVVKALALAREPRR